MAQVKKTKIEMKAQREALGRFQRFLPMLQLKKQQLQVEMQTVQHALDRNREKADGLRKNAAGWLALLAEAGDTLPDLAGTPALQAGETNIAGVVIPVFESLAFEAPDLDLFESPPWHDDARELLARLVETRAERAILEEQYRRLEAELRTTSQRVNLFEKIKIPECRDAIRVIKIFLGDQLTADVARGKAAKKATAGAAGT